MIEIITNKKYWKILDLEMPRITTTFSRVAMVATQRGRASPRQQRSGEWTASRHATTAGVPTTRRWALSTNRCHHRRRSTLLYKGCVFNGVA